MKQVDPDRFVNKKAEEISFKAIPLGEKTEHSGVKLRTSERTDGRTPARPDLPKSVKSPMETVAANVYNIDVPKERRKIRHPFDIFEDQLEALKKNQIAKRETGGDKEVLTLGDMAREALDDFIRAKTKRSANMKLVFEQDKSETQGVRSDERTDEQPSNG